MKKYSYLIILALILGLVLTGCSLLSNISQVPATGQGGVTYLTRNTKSDPMQIDLLAGQTEDIGDVNIWNDADTLHVQFVYDGPDCGFLEVHLQVDEGDFSPDILTKKGNPIPGKFEKSYDVGCFKEHTFTYDLADEGFDCGDVLVIAAHAALGQEECMTIVSGDGQTMVTQRRSGNESSFTAVNAPAVLAWEPGPKYPNDVPDDSGWEANSLWDTGLLTDLTPTGADWIWESYQIQDPVNGTVLTFKRTFDIGTPASAGNLLIACDNGYEVFLNGTSLGSNGVYGDWRNSDLYQGSVPQDGWNAVGSYPVFVYLVEGTNTLTIDVANEYFNTNDPPNPYVGTESSNPGACIFALEDICYLSSGETAWGCGIDNCTGFEGKNWATYFTYTVDCPGKILIVTQENPACTVGVCPDEEEKLIVEGYLDELEYSYDTMWEPTGGLSTTDLEGHDVVIYLSWSYPAGYANLSTAETLIDYFESGGRLIVVGDDISRVGNAGGHPYQAQNVTYGDDWEAMTRLEYINNGGSKEVGITDGYEISLGSGHPVLSGIEGETFNYYNDCDTTNFISGTGATELATSSRNSTDPHNDLSGGTAITAFDNGTGGKIVTIDVNFYGGYYHPVDPVNGPAIPIDIAKTLLGNSINWLYY